MLCGLTASAQEFRATVSVRVVDQQGGVIPGVAIRGQSPAAHHLRLVSAHPRSCNGRAPSTLKVSTIMAAQEQVKEPPVPIGAWLPAVALAWLVPGGGHVLLKRQGRAALLMASVTLMFLFGLFMRGSTFTPQSGRSAHHTHQLRRLSGRHGVRYPLPARHLDGL
jgi:hypothetical protein